MEKEKSNLYSFFILRYRLVNLQGGIFAFEKEKNYGRRKNRKRSIGKLNSPYRLSGIYSCKKYLEQGFTFANWNLGFQSYNCFYGNN